MATWPGLCSVPAVPAIAPGCANYWPRIPGWSTPSTGTNSPFIWQCAKDIRRSFGFCYEADADPGQSRYTYNSWDKLLDIAQERAFDEIAALLSGTMQERFGFDPAFAPVVEATKARNIARVEELLTENSALIHAADTLGNGTLHWAALTRQNDLIDVLVDRGAALEASRADGQTPLLVALNGDYWYRPRDLPKKAPKDPWPVVRHLLERGAEYALSIACAAGDEPRVDAILAPVQVRPATVLGPS